MVETAIVEEVVEAAIIETVVVEAVIIETASVEAEGEATTSKGVEAVIEQRILRVKSARNVAGKAQGMQAEQMLKKNKKQINSIKVGDHVLLYSDGIDRGASDPENLLCIVLEKKDISFKLGCKAGTLDSYFPFNVFTKTDLVSTFDQTQINDKDSLS